MERTEFRDLATPAEARAAIDSLALAGGLERVPLAEARGRVLVSRVDADRDVPGFDRASLDGYALRAADTAGADEAEPARLAVVGSVHAGEEPTHEVGAGEAIEISTGAVMPPGADAMVPVERTDRVDGGAETGDQGADESATATDGPSNEPPDVMVRTAVAPGENVMVAGADVAAGERALGPGTVLTPREIALLSALGCESVPVRAPPRVAVVSTGDELVRPGEELSSERGQIHDVNSYAIAAAVEDAGGEAVVYPHAGDDLEELEAVLRAAADECDLVCSSGSTSAGAVDVLYRVIEETGELLVHGVSVKPGKPMLIGRLEGSAFVGLPGYPVSAMTVFRTFVAPAIREAAGLPEPETATVTGRMAFEERTPEGRLRYVPVGLVGDGAGGTLVYPVDKGSGATTSLADADGVVEVDPDTAYLAADEVVTVECFSPEVRAPRLLGVGEADPTLWRALDRIEGTRYLPVGTRPALARLRQGVPDVAVVAGEAARERTPEATTLLEWTREWGLVVPPGNPRDVEGVADLLERDLTLANLTPDAGLRTALDERVEELADERGETPAAVQRAIEGYAFARRGLESPARRVLSGEADAGLGLAETAAHLDLGFVPLGEQSVSVLVNPTRREKPSLADLRVALEDVLE